jgi:hypothetical protein
MNYLQGENQMKTIANLTGGNSWFPQFDGELPGIFHDVASFLRHQYSLSYTPTSGGKDNKFHKVKIELVNPDGSPLGCTIKRGKSRSGWFMRARVTSRKSPAMETEGFSSKRRELRLASAGFP